MLLISYSMYREWTGKNREKKALFAIIFQKLTFLIPIAWNEIFYSPITNINSASVAT